MANGFFVYGATMYKVEGLSEKAMQFYAQNTSLFNNAFVKSRLPLRAIEVDGRIRIMIEIDEDTTTNQIRDVAVYALELRDNLLAFQGPWLGGGDNLQLEQLSRYQEHGKSYKQLARLINEKTEAYLREYLAYREEVDRLYPDVFKSIFESDFYYHVFSTQFRNNSASLIHARELLRVLAIKDEDVTEILKRGIESIKAGEKPFTEDYPIHQLKIKEKLRTWREGEKHRAIKAND
jgi:hypothetical protein